MKTLIAALLMVIGLANSAQAQVIVPPTCNNDTTIVLDNEGFVIRPGEMRSLPLAQNYYVKTLIFSLRPRTGEALYQILVNGRVKGTVNVVEEAASFFVTVEENTRSVEILSISGRAKFRSVVAVVSNYPRWGNGGNCGGQYPYPLPPTTPCGPSEAAHITANLIQMMDAFRPYVSDTNFNRYLSPIRIAAAKAMAAAQSSSSFSTVLKQELMNVLSKINMADEFLNDLLEQEAVSPLVLNVIETQKYLERALH